MGLEPRIQCTVSPFSMVLSTLLCFLVLSISKHLKISFHREKILTGTLTPFLSLIQKMAAKNIYTVIGCGNSQLCVSDTTISQLFNIFAISNFRIEFLRLLGHMPICPC